MPTRERKAWDVQDDKDWEQFVIGMHGRMIVTGRFPASLRLVQAARTSTPTRRMASGLTVGAENRPE